MSEADEQRAVVEWCAWKRIPQRSVERLAQEIERDEQLISEWDKLREQIKIRDAGEASQSERSTDEEVQAS